MDEWQVEEENLTKILEEIQVLSKYRKLEEGHYREDAYPYEIPEKLLNMQEAAPKCPCCESTDIKFCYYTNYSLSQPRYFCKNCRRYSTHHGGSTKSLASSDRQTGSASSTNSIQMSSTHHQLTDFGNGDVSLNYDLGYDPMGGAGDLESALGDGWDNFILSKRKRLRLLRILFLAGGYVRPKANREIVLPISWKDLGNTPLEENDLNWKAFLRFIRKSLLDIPPTYHISLLFACVSLLTYQAKSLTTPFDFQFGKSTNTPQLLFPFPFGEAFDAFFPEMAHIMMFMICYVLAWMLVLPLQPGAQIFFMLLLISMPLFYFPGLVRKASGVSVACSSFKLPLVGFATIGAIGLSLISGLLTLLMVYFSWRFIYKGKPRVINELEVSLDDLSEVLEGLN